MTVGGMLAAAAIAAIAAAPSYGWFSAPLTAAGAVAPSIGAGIAAAIGSYPALFIVLAAAAVGGGALTATVPSPAGPHNPGIGSGNGHQARREPPDAIG